MAMPSTFVLFLVIGLAIIGIFLIFSSGFDLSIYTVPSKTYTKSFNISAAMLVGPENVEVSKVYLQSFNISQKREEAEYNVDSKRLFSGLLFGSNAIKYDISENQIESLVIEFDVVDTNNYGALVIEVNDVVAVQEIYHQGHQKISIDESLLEDETTIEVYAASSSWKIWAPNVYELDNVRFTVKALPSKPSEMKFTLPEEIYDSFNSGRIDIQLVENTGTLVAKLNEKTIYNSSIPYAKTIIFKAGDINPGDNILRLEAGENSLFSGKAKILVFYTATSEKRILHAFNLSKAQHDKFGTGKIGFDIIDISKDGGFSVKLKYNDTTTMSEYDTAEEKSYSFSFGKEEVGVGTNVLVIESLDNSVFSVADLEVSLPN